KNSRSSSCEFGCRVFCRFLDAGNDEMPRALAAEPRAAGWSAATSCIGPRLTTWALQHVVSFLGYSGRDVDVVVTAALDPQPTFEFRIRCPHFRTFRMNMPRPILRITHVA